LAQHSITRTKNSQPAPASHPHQVQPAPAPHPHAWQCGFLYPPRKCGYPQPARVNPPCTGL